MEVTGKLRQIIVVQVDTGLKTDGKRDRFVASATKVVVLVLR